MSPIERIEKELESLRHEKDEILSGWGTLSRKPGNAVELKDTAKALGLHESSVGSVLASLHARGVVRRWKRGHFTVPGTMRRPQEPNELPSMTVVALVGSLSAEASPSEEVSPS